MAGLAAPLESLIERLARLPGIGRRSAARIALHLARRPADEVRALAEAIGRLPQALAACEVCANIAEAAGGATICPVCADPRRDRSLICVVEQPDNLAAIERTGAFHGVYHVLGGAISPLRGVGPEDLRIEALQRRVDAGGVTELILATNPTVEGEATAFFVARLLGPSGVRVTRPATGLPVGGELDYIDQATLTRAFDGRRDLPRV